MKSKISFILATLLALAFATTADAQFYQMSGGSYMTGYGQVHGSFGYAMATQQIYQTTQMQIQRLTMRAAMVKKWGEAAVRKAELEASRGSSSSSQKSSTNAPQIQVPPPPPTPKYYGRYRPDPSVNMALTISNTLFETAEERAQLKQVIEAINGAYKKEATAKGWNNNFAGGMTFFLVAMSTVYHDSPEPSEETVKAIYEAVNQSIDAVPDFAKASNKDKTTINDLLVGFSALPLATYMEAKQSGNAETLQTARALAGEMIKLVLKTEPDKFRF